jgi:hypothetical protein
MGRYGIHGGLGQRNRAHNACAAMAVVGHLVIVRDVHRIALPERPPETGGQ